MAHRKRRARDEGGEARRAELPDPEPWEPVRKPPAERPRHENAQPEDPDDPAQAGAAIEAESWGETVELRKEDTVDGDFNGAPELEALERSDAWEGVDTLDAMEGREVETARETSAAKEVLAEAVAARREVLLERLDEARELGLGAAFEAALAATDPAAPNTPLVRDDEILYEQLDLIDDALEQLELRTTEG